MAKKVGLNIGDIEKEIEGYGKNILTPEKIKNIRQKINHAKKFELTKNSSPNTHEVRYKNEFAYVNHSIKDTSDPDWTITKSIIADNYLKQGKASESYALLGNALEKFNQYTEGIGKSIKEEDKKNIYNVIEKRALRGAKKVLKKDIKLAKSFLEIAKEANKKGNMRERLEK